MSQLTIKHLEKYLAEIAEGRKANAAAWPDHAYVEVGRYKPYNHSTVEAARRRGYRVERKGDGIYYVYPTDVQPTPEQLARLQQFAAKYGVQWKAELRDQWLSGADAHQPDGHLLRQVRNQLGPQWLAKFKLPRS